MSAPFSQSEATVRLEWGPLGPGALAADACVVVDVLSFTTSVGVAVEAGARVWPFPWRDERTASYAASLGAVVAAGRRAAAPGEVSLSPVGLRAAASLERLVLPSPNGSTICAAIPEGARVVAGSLRNRTAVAAALADVLRGGGSVALVPAGERWADGSLRPAVEDLWGAGAVALELEEAGIGVLSPEARAATAAFRAVADDVPGALHACASGRELAEGGFAGDVDVAAEVDSSLVVPERGGDGAFAAQ
ncbi:hypothetical protein GCM10011519_32290 [Marmoricola endophyticus]|uniref:Probable 2-phosphosulfolactate phosphatase n=1 Tax=Marmoricola endophyticus TaxID=2040280 RepID=A0A917F6K3_9ACTN|nr:2-phosphosulfolactate phosphatase [Marmoricola endophyticus]GGF55881.1 hypothetical protein GCM10011519_32290 [Marmoricola endophyticus]